MSMNIENLIGRTVKTTLHGVPSPAEIIGGFTTDTGLWLLVEAGGKLYSLLPMGLEFVPDEPQALPVKYEPHTVVWWGYPADESDRVEVLRLTFASQTAAYGSIPAAPPRDNTWGMYDREGTRVAGVGRLTL